MRWESIERMGSSGKMGIEVGLLVAARVAKNRGQVGEVSKKGRGKAFFWGQWAEVE